MLVTVVVEASEGELVLVRKVSSLGSERGEKPWSGMLVARTRPRSESTFKSGDEIIKEEGRGETRNASERASNCS